MGDVGAQSSDDDASSGSSSDDVSTRRPHRKMEWTLIGTYPNVETMKQQFNLREWGLSTKQTTGSGAKIYYYCKECRKHGPGRLLIRYKSEESEVEILKNQLEHDHTTKKRWGKYPGDLYGPLSKKNFAVVSKTYTISKKSFFTDKVNGGDEG